MNYTNYTKGRWVGLQNLCNSWPVFFRFEALKGDRQGQYSIRINNQWRICFIWEDAPYDVEIVDCH